jgi:hypothetical protein
MNDKEKCPSPGEHKLHMCKLQEKGLMEEIDRHSAKPTVICNKCRAKADEATYLCNPRPL